MFSLRMEGVQKITQDEVFYFRKTKLKLGNVHLCLPKDYSSLLQKSFSATSISVEVPPPTPVSFLLSCILHHHHPLTRRYFYSHPSSTTHRQTPFTTTTTPNTQIFFPCRLKNPETWGLCRQLLLTKS